MNISLIVKNFIVDCCSPKIFDKTVQILFSNRFAAYQVQNVLNGIWQIWYIGIFIFFEIRLLATILLQSVIYSAIQFSVT